VALFGLGNRTKTGSASGTAGAQSQAGPAFGVNVSAGDDAGATINYSQFNQVADYGAIEGGLDAADQALDLGRDALDYYGELGSEAIAGNREIAGQAIASTHLFADEVLRRESILTGQALSNLGKSYSETLSTYESQQAAKFDAVSDAINAGAQDTARRIAGLSSAPGDDQKTLFLWLAGGAAIMFILTRKGGK
jgi:hypothetical protein